MPKALNPSTKTQIETLLIAGKTQHAVAKELDVSSSVVNKIAKEKNIPANAVDIHRLKAAHETKARYDREGRRKLGEELFDKLREIIHRPNVTAKEIKDAFVAYGIGVDKFRLEDGEATGRHEQRIDRPLDLKAEWEKLDALAAESPEPNGQGSHD